MQPDGVVRCSLPLALVALSVAGCSGKSPSLPAGHELATGTWGGENAAVVVTDSTAHVHIACTLGDIPTRITLDAEGRFAVDGSYVLRAYPIQVGPALPARFSGQVAGRTLTLSIEVSDTAAHRMVPLGPVVVVYMREPNLGPCPICRTPALRR